MTNDEMKKELSESEIMFLTIIGEARGEPIEGQVAVANVIMNRSKIRKQYIKDVCLADRQFSCWNQNDPNRRILDILADEMMKGEYNYDKYKQIQWVVDGILSNKLKDNTKGRDYYMTNSLFNSDSKPSWSKAPKTTPIKIGSHIFLNV